MDDSCPACGTPVDKTADECPTCGALYPEVESDVSPDAVAMPVNVSVPLGLLLVAILAGTFWVSPGLGIGLLLLAVPAYIRAAAVSTSNARRGVTPTAAQRLLSFVGSIGVVCVCAIAGGVAFFATCVASIGVVGLTGLFNEDAMGQAIFVGACSLGFLAAAGMTYWEYWPKLRRRRTSRNQS